MTESYNLMKAKYLCVFEKLDRNQTGMVFAVLVINLLPRNCILPFTFSSANLEAGLCIQ